MSCLSTITTMMERSLHVSQTHNDIHKRCLPVPGLPLLQTWLLETPV
jgi:hypothetical protein